MEKMGIRQENEKKLYTIVELQPEPPFACVIDGIQFTTKCTTGNQRLKVKDAQGKTIVHFKLQNSNETLKIHVNPDIIHRLKAKLSEGVPCEKLAWEIAAASADQLFTIEKQ